MRRKFKLTGKRYWHCGGEVGLCRLSFYDEDFGHWGVNTLLCVLVIGQWAYGVEEVLHSCGIFPGEQHGPGLYMEIQQ